jgi:myb proto-oncogene protein
MSLCVSWSVNKSYYGLAVQDKWRNLSVTAGGYGSREKARMALKQGKRVPKVVTEPMDVDTSNLDNAPTAVIDAKPLAMVVEPKQLECSPGKSVARLVNKYVSQLVSY